MGNVRPGVLFLKFSCIFVPRVRYSRVRYSISSGNFCSYDDFQFDVCKLSSGKFGSYPFHFDGSKLSSGNLGWYDV
jgi:hypothetical protein